MRNITFIFILSFFALTTSLAAQNPIVMATAGEAKPATFEDYLVQMAWKNNPSNETITGYEVEYRKQEVQMAKKEWLRNMSGAINLNDNNYTTLTGRRNRDSANSPITNIVTFPLVNLSFGVNLGDLVSRKYRVAAATQKQKIAEAEIGSKRLRVRGEVLGRYQKYLESLDVLKVRVQALEVTDGAKTQISNLFALNKAKFEDYSDANQAYFDAMEQKVRAESEVKAARYALEEVIGVKWETVEKVKAAYETKK